MTKKRTTVAQLEKRVKILEDLVRVQQGIPVIDMEHLINSTPTVDAGGGCNCASCQRQKALN